MSRRRGTTEGSLADIDPPLARASSASVATPTLPATDFQWVEWKYIQTHHMIRNEWKTTIIQNDQIFLNIGGSRNEQRTILSGACKEGLWMGQASFICDTCKQSQKGEDVFKYDIDYAVETKTGLWKSRQDRNAIVVKPANPEKLADLKQHLDQYKLLSETSIQRASWMRASFDARLHESVNMLNMFLQKSVLLATLTYLIKTIGNALTCHWLVRMLLFLPLTSAMFKQYVLDDIVKKVYASMWQAAPGVELMGSSWIRDCMDGQNRVHRNRESGITWMNWATRNRFGICLAWLIIFVKVVHELSVQAQKANYANSEPMSNR